MSDFALNPRSGLEEVLVPGRHGIASAPAGLVLAPVSGLALATLMVRKGESDALREAALSTFGTDLPLTPRRSVSGPVGFIWAGPGRWLATSTGESPGMFEQRLRSAFAGVASVTNQSDGRSIIRVSGPRARDALAKGVPIDLDPREFQIGGVALTIVGHINVQFWQVDDAPTYDFAVFRSFAASFCEWLLAASAEYGAQVTPAVAG